MCLKHYIRLALILLAASVVLPNIVVQAEEQMPQRATAVSQTRSTYLLGPDDLISIHAPDADEISDKPVRIDGEGYVRIPLAGRIKASGLTVEQLRASISTALKSYIKDPDVAVSIVESRSQRVSVLGAVKNPGIHQLEGHRTIIEILALAGGLADDAGHTLKITRRIEWGRIPLPSAVDDATGQFSVADVNLQDITAARNPAQNILVAPDDVISIPRAQMVYVIGTVPHPGGYVLGDRESFSVLKAASLAGGIDHGASPQKARILRAVPGVTSRQEIPVNLREIMAGRSSDVQLQPEDILLIPASGPQKAMGRVAEAALQVTTGIIIYRH
jgi:polysaccharide export outer membrane protein